MTIWENVPCCDPCWVFTQGIRKPYRLRHPRVEVCYRCQAETSSGIYVRQLVAP